MIDGAVDKFMINVRNFASGLEREKINQRTHEHLLTKARRGLNVGGRVYGYDNVEVKDGDRRALPEGRHRRPRARAGGNRVLETLLSGPLRFTPIETTDGKRYWIEGEVGLDAMLIADGSAGAVPSASPAGLVRTCTPGNRGPLAFPLALVSVA